MIKLMRHVSNVFGRRRRCTYIKAQGPTGNVDQSCNRIPASSILSSLAGFPRALRSTNGSGRSHVMEGSSPGSALE